MRNQTQISSTISPATKKKLDHFTESRGLRKSFVVEQALLYFIESRRELPNEAFIPTRIVLDDSTFDRVTELIEKPPRPTVALRELIGDHRG